MLTFNLEQWFLKELKKVKSIDIAFKNLKKKEPYQIDMTRDELVDYFKSKRHINLMRDYIMTKD